MASNSRVFCNQMAIILFLMASEGTVESMYKCLKNIYGDGTGNRSTEGCWGKFVRLAEQGNFTLYDQPPWLSIIRDDTTLL
jgi:hypothetical protein